MKLFRPCFLLPALLFIGCAVTPATPPAFAQDARVETKDNATTVTARDYVAHIDANGLLDSLVVKGTETLAEPFDFQRGAKMTIEKSEPVENGVHFSLKGPGGAAQLDYAFRPDGLTITPNWKGGLYGIALTGSEALQGFELLTSKSPAEGEAVRFTDAGIVRGVPAFQSNRNQMTRWHFADFALRVYIQRWGAPFNIEGLGTISGRRWNSDQLSGNQAYPIVFAIEKNQPASLPAVAFAPRSNKAMSLFYRDEPCVWTLDFGDKARTDALRAAGVSELQAAWTLSDINGVTVGKGASVISLAPNGNAVNAPITIQTPGSGWYQVKFHLTDAGGKMRPSEFQTRFTVINRVGGVAGRMDEFAGKEADDYSTVAMVGMGNVRESHPLGGYIRNTAPAANETQWTPIENSPVPVWINYGYLDDVFNRGATNSHARGVNWFFQWNSRPGWATPEVFEAIAFAMVSRGKKRVHVWECENEPNGGYAPKDYLEKAVIPFWKGAKRADPTAQIMGPGCVGVKPTLEFMDAIYKLGGGKYFDIISTHTYPGPGESWAQFGNPAMLERLRKLMRANGDAAKVDNIWQTEQGYSWDLNPKNQVARYVVRQFLQGAREGIAPDHQYYFYPKAHGFQPWYQAGGGEEGSRDSWLPLAAAQRFAAENLANTKFQKDEKSPYKGVYLARFTGATEDVIAAWTFDFDANVAVSAPGLKRAVDWNGNDVKLAKVDAKRVLLPLSGEPMYLHVAKGSAFDAGATWGRDLASQYAGGVATASSFSSQGNGNDGGASGSSGNAPSAANDGNWNLWESALDLPGRTAWRAGEIATPENPQWLQIDFPVARTINHILALGYIPAVNTGLRDWQLQAWQNGKWSDVASGKDFRGWAIHAQFAPITTDKIRLNITGVNDGWMLEHRWAQINLGPNWAQSNGGPDAPSYTGGKVLVSEIEAYGPEVPVRVAATLENGAAPDANSLSVRVLNMAGRAFKGTIAAQLPAGYTASPASVPIDMGANDKEKTVRFGLVAPTEKPTGIFSVGAVLRDGAGHAVDAAADSLEVKATAELSFRVPLDEDAGGFGRLLVNVHNTTPAPLEGTVEVTGASLQKPMQLPFKTAAGQSVDLSFRAPGLIPAGKTSDYTYTVRAANTISTRTQRIGLHGWRIIGPFPNDFDKAFGPENGDATPDISKTIVAPDGPSLAWKLAAEDPNGLIQLIDKFGRNENASAYAVLSFDSPTARRAILSLGSDDGVRVWLNGANVWNNNTSRAAAPGSDKVPVELKAGRNTVLLKITQGNGGWGFFFDALDAETKKPLTDLNYAIR